MIVLCVLVCAGELKPETYDFVMSRLHSGYALTDPGVRFDPTDDPYCKWRHGLTHSPLGDPDHPLRYPLFAQAQYAFGPYSGKDPEDPRVVRRLLLVPLKGASSGWELKEPLDVQPGYKFCFEACMALEGLARSRFRMGVFWEDAEGRLVGEKRGNAGSTGRWLQGDRPPATEAIDGIVPRGAVKARPYFFLWGEPLEIKGGVWLTRAEFRRDPALTVDFGRSLLVFAHNDPVEWRLRSVGLPASTYVVEMQLADLTDPSRTFRPTSSRVYVTPGERARTDEGLRLSGSVLAAFGAASARGGLYALSFGLKASEIDPVTTRLEVRFGRMGPHAAQFAGVFRSFYFDFSARDLALLERAGAWDALVADMPVYHVQLRYDSADIASPAPELGAQLARFPNVRFGALLSAEARPEDPAALAAFIGARADRIDGWELEGGAGLAAYVAAVRAKLPDTPSARIARFGSQGTRLPWADYAVCEDAAFLRGVNDAVRLVRITPGNEIAKALAVFARGVKSVVLADARQALLDARFETYGPGATPTALYGPWRTMERLLGGGAFAGEFPRIAGVRSYCFRQAENEIVALHAEKGSVPVRIPCATAVTLVDQWGNGTEVPPRDGAVEFTASESVVFVLGLAPGFDATLASVAVRKATGSGPGTLTLGLQNLTGGVVRMAITERTSRAKVEVQLTADARRSVELTVPPEAVARIRSAGAVELSVALLAGREEKHKKDLVLPVFWGERRFAVTDVRRVGGRIEFKVTNVGAEEVTAEVFRKAEGEALQPIDRCMFAPQGAATFALRAADGGAVAVSIRVQGSPPEDFPLDSVRDETAERPIKKP